MEKCSKKNVGFSKDFFANPKIFSGIFFEIFNFQRWNVFSMEPKAKNKNMPK